jgi:hypothetical protein
VSSSQHVNTAVSAPISSNNVTVPAASVSATTPDSEFAPAARNVKGSTSSNVFPSGVTDAVLDPVQQRSRGSSTHNNNSNSNIGFIGSRPAALSDVSITSFTSSNRSRTMTFDSNLGIGSGAFSAHAGSGAGALSSSNPVDGAGLGLLGLSLGNSNPGTASAQTSNGSQLTPNQPLQIDAIGLNNLNMADLLRGSLDSTSSSAPTPSNLQFPVQNMNGLSSNSALSGGAFGSSQLGGDNFAWASLGSNNAGRGDLMGMDMYNAAVQSFNAPAASNARPPLSVHSRQGDVPPGLPRAGMLNEFGSSMDPNAAPFVAQSQPFSMPPQGNTWASALQSQPSQPQQQPQLGLANSNSNNNNIGAFSNDASSPGWRNSPGLAGSNTANFGAIFGNGVGPVNNSPQNMVAAAQAQQQMLQFMQYQLQSQTNPALAAQLASFASALQQQSAMQMQNLSNGGAMSNNNSNSQPSKNNSNSSQNQLGYLPQ